jgi:hypothetical protein
MSQENVEIFHKVVRLYEADDLDGIKALLHPEVESTPVEGWPEPGPFIGRDELLAQFERNTAEVEEHRISNVSIVAEDQDWVVGEFRWEVRGLGSGIQTHLDVVAAQRVERDRIVELHFRLGREAALEAAGLRL